MEDVRANALPSGCPERVAVGRTRLSAPSARATLVPMAARVLIVDDDPVFRDLAAELLRALGYEVVGHAPNAAQALAAVARLRPDAVLLDVNLPDADGFRVAETIAESDVVPRVLLVSSDSERVQADTLRRCGAVGFVPKTELATTDLAPYLGG